MNTRIRDGEAGSQQSQATLRRYALFVHYAIKEDAQLDEANLDVLLEDLRYLCQILQPEAGWIGTAYVFVDPRWMQLFDEHGGFADGVQFGARIARLKKLILERLPEASHCIRLISADDMSEIMTYVSEHSPPETASLRRLLTGDSQKSLYDIPKVVKWLAQSLNAGKGIPFFTFDLDVLFFRVSAAPNACAREFRKKVRQLCRYYVAKPAESNFIFSGCYLDPATQDAFRGNSTFKGIDGNDQVIAALNGFASRSLMLADIASKEEQNVTLDPDKVSLFMRTLKHVGSDAFDTVISGAGICVSDAIARFPAHSETGVNFVWTDDALLYWFHHHLCQIDKPDKPPVVYEACFTKPRVQREPGSAGVDLKLKDVKWHLRNYLPGLVLGCVADAWINRKNSVGKVDGAGPYAKYVACGLLDDDQSRQELRRKLWDAARGRLCEVVELWGGKEFKDTYLGVFVKGGDDPDRWNERGFFPDFAPCGLERAVNNLSSTLPGDTPLPSGGLSLRDSLLAMIDGWIVYLDFCRYWRTLVDAARQCIDQPGSPSRDTWFMQPIELVTSQPIDLLLQALQSDISTVYNDASVRAAENSWPGLDLAADENLRSLVIEHLEGYQTIPNAKDDKQQAFEVAAKEIRELADQATVPASNPKATRGGKRGKKPSQAKQSKQGRSQPRSTGKQRET